MKIPKHASLLGIRKNSSIIWLRKDHILNKQLKYNQSIIFIEINNAVYEMNAVLVLIDSLRQNVGAINSAGL